MYGLYGFVRFISQVVMLLLCIRWYPRSSTMYTTCTPENYNFGLCLDTSVMYKRIYTYVQI